MRRYDKFGLLSIMIGLGAASPAFAEDGERAGAEGPQIHGSVYAMAAATPDYLGSDDYRAVPFGGAYLQYGNFYFVTEGSGASLNVSPVAMLVAGPSVNYRIGRQAEDIDSAAVSALGDLDDAFEAGGFIGVRFNGLLSPQDRLQVSSKILFDVSDTHDGHVGEIAVQYELPVSRRFAVTAQVNGSWASKEFVDYQFGIDQAGAVASGLSEYEGKAGFYEVRSSLIGRFLVSDHVAVMAIGSYGHLLDNAADSPLVETEGSESQFFGGLGLAYMF
tara:strand:- start:33054 stop:33878 length:825 start_codon:yes stop_codon:yes gene_type:complete